LHARRHKGKNPELCHWGNEVKKQIVFALAVLVALAGCLSTNTQTTDFFSLVKTGTPQSVQAAISNGAEVNARDEHGWTVLMVAAMNNPNPGVITALLKAGADIEARDSNGQTPLMFASGNKNAEVITTLLKAGADLNGVDMGGRTPLIVAAMGSPNPEAITTLLNAGADINAREANGMTALMWAAWNNPNPEVIITLLKAGADAKARSEDGKTATDYAQEAGLLKNTDAYRLLSEAQSATPAAQPKAQSLVSTDGSFTIYIPDPSNPDVVQLTDEQAAANKKLFALMESQVKNRPVMVSFDGSLPGSFVTWMMKTYGYDLHEFWHGAFDYLDRTEDNDFVIEVRPRYSNVAGMEIVVMTYQYFLALH
jgi:ankyrin repeat protein